MSIFDKAGLGRYQALQRAHWIGRCLVEAGTLSPVSGCSNHIYLKIPPSHPPTPSAQCFSELINRVTQVSIKGCW